MKVTVDDLKLLKKMVDSANAEDEVMLTRFLRKKQPGFFSLIEDVAMDPRCAEACRYCTLFCGLLLERVELRGGEMPSAFAAAELHELAGHIVRQDKHIGGRAAAFPGRIRRHVLAATNFDDGDSAWLCMMIAALLTAIERFFADL